MKLIALSSVFLAIDLVRSAAIDVDLHSQLVANVSSVFGWQLAGSQQSLAALRQGCQDIASFGHGHWSDLGLNLIVIAVLTLLLAETFCAAALAGMSNITAVALAQINICAPGNEIALELAAAHVEMAKLTNLIFQWQLLIALDAVFDPTKKTYLCKNLDEVALLWKAGATGQILACGGLLPDEDYPPNT
ncbi:hypothetical protein E4T39_08460 [Aureobasidium subglaciale]|nr:hypothetical protein E4T39_08460 [Aureobasidium subglaciale]